MAEDYLVGYRVKAGRASSATLGLAIDEAARELSEQGVLIESWDYEDTSGLLLVHLRVGEPSLTEAVATLEEVLARHLACPIERARLSRSGNHLIEVKSVLPSAVTLGFLLRAARRCRGYAGLSATETLALISYYLLNGDMERVMITLSFLGLHPHDVDAALRKLRERGLVNLDNGLLSEEAVKALDVLIPSLRMPVSSAKSPRLKVVDEDGGVEEFSADKLARSLYRAGIPHRVVSKVVPSILEALTGREYVSKRALVSMTCSLLEELEPSTASAIKFINYVYALERTYVKSRGGLKQLSWRILRSASREVLKERGLRPPPRLVRLHSELLADDLRSRLSWTPWRTRAWIIDEGELLRIARELAPRVSNAWAQLSSISVGELSLKYWRTAISTLSIAAKSTDHGERKELIVRGLLELSSSLLMSLGLLPSNLVELNLGVLKYEVKRRAALSPEQGAKWRRFKRLCSLSLKLARSPAITSPSEDVRIRGMLEEVLSLTHKLSP
ncbi:MAG: hypothetical protein DRK00_00065 [Thermoprotei archaeon]|nr:MAG: hypothetical protein DRK00_00065 [Thermoprotei archaeon]